MLEQERAARYRKSYLAAVGLPRKNLLNQRFAIRAEIQADFANESAQVFIF